MNKNLRKAMISAVCMLIVGVMSLTGVTYAWFTSAKSATVSGVNVSIVSADGGVQLEDNDGNWTYTLTAVDENNNPDSTDDDKKNPVSAGKTLNSSNELNFFTATVDDPNDSAVITSVADKTNYFVDHFRMKNPNAATATVTLQCEVATNQNIVKNALRWAIVHTTDEGVTKVYFFAGNNSQDNLPGEDGHDYLAVVKAATAFDSTVESDNVEWVALNELGDFKATVEPVELNEDGTEKDNNAHSFILYAWLEGNDADCTNSLAGSSFSVNLTFNTELAEIK